MKVKFSDVVQVKIIDGKINFIINEDVANLLAMPINNAQLNYDVSSKFVKAVQEVTTDFDTQIKKIYEKYVVETKITDIENFNKEINELLNVEVEFNCYALKLERFEKENLVWKVNGEAKSVQLGKLEKFLEMKPEG